jgi:hypothetical protein
MSLLEVGVAFTHYLDDWERFHDVYYMGVDTRAREVLTAQNTHPSRLFVTMAKSELLHGNLLHAMPPDAIVLLDPALALNEEVCSWVFAAPVEYIVRACWWNALLPRGWDIVHRDVCDEAALVVLARNS